jgi:hypothetical protein
MRKQERRKRTGWTNTRNFLARLGPGLIAGASDDDPSGIATYSQSGSRFGYSLLWTLSTHDQIFVAYSHYVTILKWLTLALFAQRRTTKTKQADVRDAHDL